MLHEPDVVEAHLVGEDYLIKGLAEQQPVVQLGPRHLVVQAHFHT